MVTETPRAALLGGLREEKRQCDSVAQTRAGASVTFQVAGSLVSLGPQAMFLVARKRQEGRRRLMSIARGALGIAAGLLY